MTLDFQNLTVCETCGTQYDVPFENRPSVCRMCLDPRQFVPPSGHSFSSLAKIQKSHTNAFIQDEGDSRVYSIVSKPQFAIGQRAVFIQTPAGNVLWDCISLLDEDTINFIKSRGGLKAIAISHPHFYTSHLTWAKTFDCPVYMAADDAEWVNCVDEEKRRVFVEDETLEILPGVTMVKLGGHFPGSSVLHWDDKIFTGDTIGVSNSGLNREHHRGEHQVFFYHYAFPNFIPLGPSAMQVMWERLRPWNFQTVYSLFPERTVRDPDAKGLILRSMQMQAKYQENDAHPLLKEKL